MRFLDGADAQSELGRLIGTSKLIRIAVAFWGQPAPKILGLLDKNESPEIICNLKMGGTNPEAIEELLNSGITVFQSDELHGKVYLFDSEAIVGSSNASANGLSLQDGEASGWHEANILVSEPPILNQISAWLDKLPRRKITSDDLAAAKEAWSRRRRVAGILGPPSKINLIDALRSRPSDFKGRRIFVCVYSEGLSTAGEKSLKFARKEAGPLSDSIDGFEWDDLPDFADLICFQQTGKRRFSHDGLWHMPEVREEITKYGTKLQICRRLKAVAGYPQSRLGSALAWTPALGLLMEGSKDPTGRFMDLGDFSEKYLRGA
jgi:hypothetical protein